MTLAFALGSRPVFLVRANGLLHSIEAVALGVEEGRAMPSALEIVLGAMNSRANALGWHE